MVNLHLKSRFVGQSLEFKSPDSSAWSTASTIRRDHHTLHLWKTLATELFPPKLDGGHREFCGVVADAHCYTGLVVGDVVDTVRNRLAELLAGKSCVVTRIGFRCLRYVRPEFSISP